MKVFISWSGSHSKKVAEALRDWLPGVLQLVKPYFTPSDIEKGTRWGQDIAKELESSEVGILCITRDNIHSDWIMFEAGALSKSLDKSHVCPILFGITNTDLAGPLKQFQTTEFTKQDIHKLINVINSRLNENKLPQKTIDSVFDKWWPELECQINQILSEDLQKDEPVRSERDLLVEILEISRATDKRASRSSASLSPRAIEELITRFIQLHDEQVANNGSYQDTLDTLQTMDNAIGYIATRYRGHSPELDHKIKRLSLLDYKAFPVKEESSSDDEIPF
jgi:hypothetical protein